MASVLGVRPAQSKPSPLAPPRPVKLYGSDAILLGDALAMRFPLVLSGLFAFHISHRAFSPRT